MPRHPVVALLSATLGLLASAATALAAPVPPAPHQAALVAFFTETGGPDWVDDTGWRSRPIACDAKGLTCDAAGNVLEIFLVDNGLQGELPASLVEIDTLRGIVLNRNLLAGPIPPAWSDFNALQLLSLRDNAVDGAMADTLSGNSTLKVIDLCHNHLSGTLPDAFLDMPELGTLALCNNDLEGALPDVGNAAGLIDLDLSSNAFSGSIDDSYFSMPALWDLNLADNALSGRLPTALAQPAPLVLLDLSGNRLGGLLTTQLSQFPDLSRVSLARNRLRGSLPESLQDLPQLRHVDLSGNRFTGSIPAALEAHAGLLAGAATGDASVLLDWNPLSADTDSIAWLNTVGTDPDTLVGPITSLQLDDVSDATQLRWTPQSFPLGTEGYYRIESAAGEEIARTTDLSVGHVTLDANLEVDATELRVVTVLPAHDANPNAVEGPASSPQDTDQTLWTPASVSHPVNHGPFERPAWAVVSDSVLITITEVAIPDLFSEQPDVSTDGTLRFTPAGRVGMSRAVVTVRENGGTRTLEFDITVGESANRAPSFRPGENITVDARGSMQVVEWASALDDGDNSTQSMQFVLDNPSPDWFAVQPELSVPSGTLRFRFNPGQTGSVTLSVRLEDNGGTDNGGVDRSPAHALTLTASEAGQGVGGAGVASDTAGTGGGAAFGLLWLGVMARHRRLQHPGQ